MRDAPDNPAARWTALVLAGERPGGNPLTRHFGVSLKALLPLAGEPMIAHVLSALLAAPTVRHVVVLTQSPDMLRVPATEALLADPRITIAASGNGIARSVAAVAGSRDAPWPVLVTTADHALLTPAMIAEFLAGVGANDVAVGVVERAVIHAHHPESRRTWLRFRGGAYSGANLFALSGERSRAAVEAWAAVEADRKRAFRLMWRIGPLLALAAAMRAVSLAAALRAAGRRLGVSAAAVELGVAEAAMDVDSIADAETAERILGARGGRNWRLSSDRG